MTQTLEILLGMAVFYFVFSPRFRKFVKKCINSWQPRKDAPKVQEQTEIIRPAQISRMTRKKSPDVNGAGQLEVDDDVLAQYLQNPEVKVRQ